MSPISGRSTASAVRRRRRIGSPGASAPIVIAHRGASGYRPEHTLAAYELAIKQGADFIEPDLVSTKDGVLVARHENEISRTTDVAERSEFADRRTTKIINGHETTGWFAEDFTLAELKTLRARERIPELRPGNTVYDGRYPIPTLQDIVDLARRWSRQLGRPVGIYPETKYPSYFRSIGLPLDRPLVHTLRRNGLDAERAPVFIQSFETGILKALRTTFHVQAPLVQLIAAHGAPYDLAVKDNPTTYADLAGPAGLAEISTYADAVGVDKTLIRPHECAEGGRTPTDFVHAAHSAGLLVHAWTFRNENAFLPEHLRAGMEPGEHGHWWAEYQAFFGSAGSGGPAEFSSSAASDAVDGVFSDHPDSAVSVRNLSSGRAAVA